MKLGPLCNDHKGRAIRPYANQPARPLWLLCWHPNFMSFDQEKSLIVTGRWIVCSSRPNLVLAAAVPEIRCSDRQQLVYYEPQAAASRRQANTFSCGVSSATSCRTVTRTDCKRITWNECREVTSQLNGCQSVNKISRNTIIIRERSLILPTNEVFCRQSVPNSDVKTVQCWKTCL